MGRAIIYAGGVFFEWSTVVDAPISTAMSRTEMHDYLLREYGRHDKPDERLDRAEKFGTSAFDSTLEGLISVNRAGPNESRLSLEEIIADLKAERHA